MKSSRALRRQAIVTAVVVGASLVALLLAARLMYVSDRDALFVSVLVLAAGIVTVRTSALAERERERAAAEATRRQLVAAVSHDLRTPIASLQLLVEAIDDGLVDDETRTRYLATMHTHIRSLSAMIDELFELSRIEAGAIDWSIRQVELALLLDETVTAMAPEARAQQIELRTQLGSDALVAEADPEKVQRVLFNLIRNAIRHTPADGTITVAADGDSKGVEIEVSDTGPGISAADRDRVFEAFYRGESDAARCSDGAGLGLAVARAIVEAHGGRIWLAAVTDGTSVRFRLPRHPPG
ncbi:MAG TPA: HAMP domain-containing sensor histidine kinase [Baekduia sp.]|nr:HAMP domain-containing sensor histidine kinase [Baekduia sp.]